MTVFVVITVILDFQFKINFTSANNHINRGGRVREEDGKVHTTILIVNAERTI